MELLRFLDNLQKVATSPWAFLAYVVLIIAWVYISRERNRLDTIARTLKKIPPKDRAMLIMKEYNTTPRKGLSAEQWIRSRRQNLLFSGFIAVLFTILILFLVSMLPTHRSESSSIQLMPPIYERAVPAAYHSDATQGLKVEKILEGSSNGRSRIFEVVIKNLTNRQKILSSFHVRWRYLPGETAGIAVAQQLSPVSGYHIDLKISMFDLSLREMTQPVYPLLVLPPANESGPSYADFLVTISYDFEESAGYHASTNWDIVFDVELIDESHQRYPLLRKVSWNNRKDAL